MAPPTTDRAKHLSTSGTSSGCVKEELGQHGLHAPEPAGDPEQVSGDPDLEYPSVLIRSIIVASLMLAIFLVCLPARTPPTLSLSRCAHWS